MNVTSPQHYEIGWILGQYALTLSNWSPAADPLEVVMRQLGEAELLFGSSVIQHPVSLPLTNVGWENLYARMGTVAYVATALATVPSLREVLLGLVERWRRSTFCVERQRFRYQYGILTGSLPDGSATHRIEDFEGTRFLIKVITWHGAAKPGDQVKMVVTILSRTTRGNFSDFPGFEPEMTILGKDAIHHDPAALADLLNHFKHHGPPSWERAIGEDLAARTALPVPAAALVWAANTEATNALRVVAAPDTRKALALTAKQVDSASSALRPLYDCRSGELPPASRMSRQGFYDVYQHAMPLNVGSLWTPCDGGSESVVARLADAISRKLATK